jgi:hypothetical protein
MFEVSVSGLVLFWSRSGSGFGLWLGYVRSGLGYGYVGNVTGHCSVYSDLDV